jgi:hypothetical protein
VCELTARETRSLALKCKLKNEFFSQTKDWQIMTAKALVGWQIE